MTSIRGRLLFMLLGGLAFVLLCGGAAVYWIERESLLQQLDQLLESRAAMLASLIKLEPEGLVFESSDVPAALMAETYFELRDESGTVLKRSRNLGEFMLPAATVPVNHFQTGNTPLPDGLNGRVVWHSFKPRIDPDDWSGHDTTALAAETLSLTAVIDRSAVDRALRTLLTALLIVGGALSVTVTLMVVFGVRWALAPLGRLSRQLGTVSGATMSERLQADRTPRELAPVYRELNAMLDRVEQTLDRERSFIDSAAHELRTPLTELRTVSEVALKWPDPQRAMNALAEALAICSDMERLVESLMMISRAQNTGLNPVQASTTLQSIVQPCIERSASIIQAKHLKLSVDLPVGATLSDHQTPEAIQIILKNLIDNAVQYTPPGGIIVIRQVERCDGPAVLVVENDPVALSESDLHRLFEPFWRKDGARTDRQHAGLGLSVVHRMAATLGLRIEAALNGDRLQMRLFKAV